jgi:hypothetical protein
MADILGMCDGKFFAIEVKTPKAHKSALTRPTSHDLDQQRFLFMIQEHGGKALRVSDLESVKRFITSMKDPSKESGSK